MKLYSLDNVTEVLNLDNHLIKVRDFIYFGVSKSNQVELSSILSTFKSEKASKIMLADNDKYMIKDLKTEFGFYINNDRVVCNKRAVLKINDVIGIGCENNKILKFKFALNENENIIDDNDVVYNNNELDSLSQRTLEVVREDLLEENLISENENLRLKLNKITTRMQMYKTKLGAIKSDIPKIFNAIKMDKNSSMIAKKDTLKMFNELKEEVMKKDDYIQKLTQNLNLEKKNGSDLVDKVKKDLNAVFECPICLDLPNNNACSLNCGHVFCKPCISASAKGNVIQCPLCQNNSTLKNKLSPALIVNQAIKNLKDTKMIYDELAKLENEKQEDSTTTPPSTSGSKTINKTIATSANKNKKRKTSEITSTTNNTLRKKQKIKLPKQHFQKDQILEILELDLSDLEDDDNKEVILKAPKKNNEVIILD